MLQFRWVLFFKCYCCESCVVSLQHSRYARGAFSKANIYFFSFHTTCWNLPNQQFSNAVIYLQHLTRVLMTQGTSWRMKMTTFSKH